MKVLRLHRLSSKIGITDALISLATPWCCQKLEISTPLTLSGHLKWSWKQWWFLCRTFAQRRQPATKRWHSTCCTEHQEHELSLRVTLTPPTQAGTSCATQQAVGYPGWQKNWIDSSESWQTLIQSLKRRKPLRPFHDKEDRSLCRNHEVRRLKFWKRRPPSATASWGRLPETDRSLQWPHTTGVEKNRRL